MPLTEQEKLEDIAYRNFHDAAELIIEGLSHLDSSIKFDDDNFRETPQRFAKACMEIYGGCSNTQNQVDEILSTSFPSNGSNDMVIEKDIVCFSMCPHHLLPVEYHVCVGYIPNKNGRVLGISKLARLVNVLSKRPVLQEEFTKEIVKQLEKIDTQGSIAVVEGRHMCMRMRGVKSPSSSVSTTSLTGIFQYDHSAKQEFMENIRDRMGF